MGCYPPTEVDRDEFKLFAAAVAKTVVFLALWNDAHKPHFLGWFMFINSFKNQSEANE
jgi:hypothetical protein